MEGNLHFVFNGNALRGRTPDAVDLDIRNIAFGSVDKADLFRDPGDIAVRHLFVRLVDVHVADPAVFTGQRNIGKPRAVRQRDDCFGRFSSVPDRNQHVVPAPDRFKIEGCPAPCPCGRRLVFLFRCPDRPGAVVHGLPAEPDFTVFIIIHIPGRLFIVMDAPVQRVEQDHSRGCLLTGILVPAGQVNPRDFLPDKNPV